MNLYLIISLTLFLLVATVGIGLKIYLRRQRKIHEGLQGFIIKQEQEKPSDDGWENL